MVRALTHRVPLGRDAIIQNKDTILIMHDKKQQAIKITIAFQPNWQKKELQEVQLSLLIVLFYNRLVCG